MNTTEFDGELRRNSFLIQQQQDQLVRLDAAIVERRTALQLLEKELQQALLSTPRRL